MDLTRSDSIAIPIFILLWNGIQSLLPDEHHSRCRGRSYRNTGEALFLANETVGGPRYVFEMPYERWRRGGELPVCSPFFFLIAPRSPLSDSTRDRHLFGCVLFLTLVGTLGAEI